MEGEQEYVRMEWNKNLIFLLSVARVGPIAVIPVAKQQAHAPARRKPVPCSFAFGGAKSSEIIRII